ncbi:hypothetical protein JG688_00013452 [Phytophthora aleatoria]|uniref:Uncharacterized protein n=1 Tax=Phytophthora aleatoria TaxID=2496075 RepID=A0A8J5MED9_9STRA|nr:hypothetical protein JG688_00013452 [Phytophthora aleatoria]
MALGSAAPFAPTLLCSKFESDPASNHWTEVGSVDTTGHHSAQLKPGALPTLSDHLAA